MTSRFRLGVILIATTIGAVLITPPTAAQNAPAPATPARNIPADPWPRKIDLANGSVLLYQPQVNKWEGNQLDFRAALAIQPVGAKEETFGVIFATTRTQVDRVARTVVFENLRITKTDFPTLPDRGAAYTAELQKNVANDVRTISLDRLEASLAAAGIKPPTVAVQNNPPQVLVSYSPAILVPIDGPPNFKEVPDDSRFQRVINTRALILKGGFGDKLYMHVYDGWLEADAIQGPWTRAPRTPFGMEDAAKKIAKSDTVDMLDGGPKANPKPTLANGVPAIYTSQTPRSSSCSRGSPTSFRSSARSSCGRPIRRATC